MQKTGIVRRIVKGVLIVAIAAVVATGGWFMHQSKQHALQAQAAIDARNIAQADKLESQAVAEMTTEMPVLDGPLAGWTEYNNPKYGFSVTFPQGWKLNEAEESIVRAPNFLEFTAIFQYPSNQRYSTIAELKVQQESMVAVTKAFDSLYLQQSMPGSRQDITQNGQKAVAYNVYTATGQAKIYVIGAGNTTYVLSSANEDLNESRLPTYWADFDQVFDSLTLK